MGIMDGRLTLVPRTESRGLHLPIDFFFRSLARDRSTQAIGVVLSGNGSDGTEGVRAIKAEGGVTLAQDEKSAKYESMPASATASGCIDFVLPPEGIAGELARFGAHPYIARKNEPGADDLLEETEEELARIFLLVRDATEVDFSQYKPVDDEAPDPAAHGAPQGHGHEELHPAAPGGPPGDRCAVPGLS